MNGEIQIKVSPEMRELVERLEKVDIGALLRERDELRTALNDAIQSPMGVVPVSAHPFYDWQAGKVKGEAVHDLREQVIECTASETKLAQENHELRERLAAIREAWGMFAHRAKLTAYGGTVAEGEFFRSMERLTEEKL